MLKTRFPDRPTRASRDLGRRTAQPDKQLHTPLD